MILATTATIITSSKSSPSSFPAFHNEAYTDDDQGDQAETQQVGRFAISEDQ